MKPEVQAILRKIGWDVFSQCHPFFVLQVMLPFVCGPLVKRDSDARKQARAITKAFKLAVDLQKALGEISVETRRNIALTTVGKEEMLAALASQEIYEPPQVVENTQAALWQLMIGLEATEARLEHLGGKPNSGGSKNLQAHEIAFAAATIYFIGMGELPKAYNSTSKDGLGGLFGQTVDELFDVMGLGYSAVGPCKEAIKRLQALPDEELEALALLRDAETRSQVELAVRRVF